MRRALLRSSAICAIAMSASLIASPSFAQSSQSSVETDSEIEDVIIVTTQRRAQNLQDVPISLDVLGTIELENRNIQGFADYAAALPSLTYSSGGPGLNSLFFRGLGASGAASQTATRPGVSIYLDDQPVSSYGFNLDVQVYDVARIEAAAGPQSTLYGAASSSGALRILTNQPDPSQFDAGIDVSAHKVFKGSEGFSAEGFVNIPISERVALRLVGWSVENAGYIDNVASTFVVPPVAISGGARLGDRAGQTIENSALVEDDFNTETKVGARAALGIDLNDSWTATLRAQYQEQETDGVFFHDPVDIDDLDVSRFFEDRFRDEFTQIGATVEGKIGTVTLNYSGSYVDREIEYDNDYTEYAVNYNYIDYYTCEYSYASYSYECNEDPRIFYTNDTTETIQTHEFRILTDQTKRLRAIAGLFYNQQKTTFLTDFLTPAVAPGAIVTFSPNASSQTYFIGDQERLERDVAAFGEVTYDIIPSVLEGTIGFRYNKTTSELDGAAGYQSGPVFIDTRTTNNQSLFKANLSWHVNDDILTYVTFSQGFRPGGVNRIQGATVPLVYQPDYVDNYEFGWKTTSLDGRLRFNGAAFYVSNRDFQFGRFSFAEAPLLLVTNVGDTRSIGVETDFEFDATDNLTFSGGFVILDSELSEDAFFGGEPARAAGGVPDAPSGTTVPFAPSFNATLSARYERSLSSDIDMHWQADVNYNGSSFNGLTGSAVFPRVKQNDYTLINIAAGISKGNVRAGISLENATDSRGEVTIGSTGSPTDIFIPRPRTVFVKLGYDF